MWGAAIFFSDFRWSAFSGLVKQTGIYTLPNLVRMTIPIFLLPIMSRYLTPGEYGIVATFIAATSVMVSFVGLNLDPAIGRAYVDYGKEDLAKYIGTAFIILIISFGVNFSVLFLFRVPIAGLFKLSSQWFLWIILVAFSQVCASIMLMIWRMEEKAVCYSFFKIAESVIQVSLAVYLVVILLLHWQGRLLSIIITSVLFAMLSAGILYKNGFLKLDFNKTYAKEMLWFGVPLIPHVLSSWVLHMSDRLFINAMLGTASTGIYSVGYAIGNAVGMVQYAFCLAWIPILYKKLKHADEKTKKDIVKFTYLHHIMSLLGAVILGLACPYVIGILVGVEFQESVKFVFIIALGYAFQGMYLMVGAYISYARKTQVLAIGSLTACMVNIVLNYILINRNGAIGAAQSTLVSFIVLYLITFWLSNNAFKMPWFFWRS